MNFLSSLAKSINDTLSTGENEIHSLDELSKFRIDRSVERTYIEDGYIKNISPRQREVLMQQPDMTVLVKKRMFSSLAQNFRTNMLNEDEKLFIKASKKLFENKCKAISAYEKLVKINKVVNDVGIFNKSMLPQIFDALDALESGLGSVGIGRLIDEKTKAYFNTIRNVYKFSEVNNTTTWIKGRDNNYSWSNYGGDTGVIELTLVSNVSTSVSVKFGGGSASLNIENPYNLLTITNYDIDKAISDASNLFKNNDFFTFATSQLEKVIEDNKANLNNQRRFNNAPPILFLTNPDTLLGHKVRAIIGESGKEISFNYEEGLFGINGKVEVDPSAIAGTEASQLPNGLGKFALTKQDEKLFSQIISDIYKLLNLQRQTKSEIINWNEKTNYVRRKMRLHFAGKSIIQPMDVVNIFISSKSRFDSRVTSGIQYNFASSHNFLSTINSLAQDFTSELRNIFGGSGVNSRDYEKHAIVGSDFPDWIWNIIKADATSQPAGMCVFSGIVRQSQQTYSGDKYSINVSVSDNTDYFNKGQINFNPSIDVYNAPLYDPLTPFDISYDAASGFKTGGLPSLLPENQELLLSGIVRFKNGRFRGSIATPELYQIGDSEPVSGRGLLANNTFRKVLNDPNGLVYRWKQGIGSITNLNEPHHMTELSSESMPRITTDPFAGQDVMNVISLLVTGQPYNFNTFMKSAISLGGLTVDEITGDFGQKSFLRGFIDEIGKQNQIWGNFIPFKKLVVSESAYRYLASDEVAFTTINHKLNDLIKQRSDLFDELASKNAEIARNPKLFEVYSDGSVRQLVNQPEITDEQEVLQKIQELDVQIEEFKSDFAKKLSNPSIQNSKDGTIKIFGDDISYQDTSVSNSSFLNEEQRNSDREELRKKVNSLTLRRLWKVKANEDPNLFIVDDSYDKDYDIQAFEKAINQGALSLFNSEYQTVGEAIKKAATLLGLEVYADSQGHIRVRPPQYNKTPSSVFYRMFRDRDTNGIQVFPEFLEKLFVNQITSVFEQIEIIEDQIRLRAIALGYRDDIEMQSFLSGSIGNTSGNANIDFTFVTNEATGTFGSGDIKSTIYQANPDVGETINSKLLSDISSSIDSQVSSVRNFDALKRLSVITNRKFSDDIDADKLLKIQTRLTRKLNSPAPTIRELLPNHRINSIAGRSQSDIVKLINEISLFVSQRQRLLLTVSNTIKNLESGAELNNSGKGFKQALYSGISRKNSIPDILQYMIEDEQDDDLGPGSGSRYVIKDSQIISLDITENPPPYTHITVNGRMDLLIPDPAGLEGAQGGNFVSQASATDYDMWRMYGFIDGGAHQAPFLSHADNQCAPFAVFLLNLARKQILSGRVQIVGNEYMQAGDVVYIESRDLLFYVEEVSHSFGFGGSFTTSLTLTYGRTPGEYIPTMLDIIGKTLYNNRNLANEYRLSRFSDAGEDMSVGAVGIDLTQSVPDNFKEYIVTGSAAKTNKKTITDALLTTLGLNSSISLNKKPSIELRVYYNSKTQARHNDVLTNLSFHIKEWLLNPTDSGITGEDNFLSFNIPDGFGLSKDQVKIVIIDLGENTPHSPSSHAWDLVRDMTDVSITDSMSNMERYVVTNKRNDILYNSIIDVWITYEDIEPSISSELMFNESGNEHDSNMKDILEEANDNRNHS